MAKKAKDPTEEKEPRKHFLHLIQKRKYRLTFVEHILGMSPLNKDIYEQFIVKKAKEKNPNFTDEMATDELSMIEEYKKAIEEKMTGFHKDDDGIYLGDWQVRGFLKTAANNLKNVVNVINFKSKLENFVFVFPRHIYLKEKPDCNFSRPIRAQTAQGPRSSIKCSEQVDAGVQITIEIQLLPHPEITFPILEEIMCYGLFEGISEWRGGSYGRFFAEEIIKENGSTTYRSILPDDFDFGYYQEYLKKEVK